MNLLSTHLSTADDKLNPKSLQCKSDSNTSTINEAMDEGLKQNENVDQGNISASSSGSQSSSKKRKREEHYRLVLGERGISTVNRVLSSSNVHLMGVFDGTLSLSEIRWLKSDLARKTMPRGIRLSEMLDTYRIYTKCLSTGSSALDELLSGGLLTAELTEIAGPAASGKTQLCLSALATLLLDNNAARAVYIDAGKSSFNAGRLREILLQRIKSMDAEVEDDQSLAQKYSDRVAQCLERVRCMRIYDIDSLAYILTEQIAEYEDERQIKYGAGALRLVVIDAISSIFAPLVGGGGKAGGALCFSAMLHIAQLMRRLAEQLNLAILLTNSVVLDKTHGTKPALGRTWTQEPNIRVQLSPVNEESKQFGSSTRHRFSARLTKSCRSTLDVPSITYTLGPSGFCDSF